MIRLPPLSCFWIVVVAATAPAQQKDLGKAAPALKAPVAATAAAPAAAPVDFLRDVRPILAQHCYACHGPDDGTRKAGLRLDRREDAFRASDDGAPFVAGKTKESHAYLRMIATDPEERMPPPEAGPALKPSELEILARWIDGGAVWNEHWAFVAPIRPELPAVKDAAWPKGEIDRFVLARLEAEGRKPSPEASREEWLRRVTLDLTGLPPTIEETDSFLRDTTPTAFETVVDRLLASPRYGERQAADWMDVARYADSSGYQRDSARQNWKWREWAIQAFNKNQPYDRFVVEQLAGDLLPGATLDQKIATGFNRNHPVNTEAGEEPDEYRSAYVIDRVHATSTAFLGLTVACAQCHDHKYDPISQRDFYSFYGFFNQVKERDSGGFGGNPKPSIAAPGPDDVPRLADLDRRIKTLEKRLDQPDPLADEAQVAWERATRERIGAPIGWTVLEPTELMARHGSRLKRLEDGSILATGPTPARDTYEMVFAPGKRKITAIRLEALPDPSLPQGASGRADDGRFILSSFESRLASVADSEDPPLVAFALAAADLNQKADEDEHYLTAIEPGDFAGSVALGSGDDGGKGGGDFRFGGGGWSVAGEDRKEAREAVLLPVEALVANDTSILRLTLHHRSKDKFKSLMGRFRVSITEDPRVRSQLLAVAPSLWRALGPFPAETAEAAFTEAFEPEKDFATAEWKKKYDQPILSAKPAPGAPGGKPGEKPNDKPSDKPTEKPADKPDDAGKPTDAMKPADVATSKPAPESKPAADGKAAPESKPASEGKPGPESKPVEKPKPRRLEWAERRDWRDGDSARLDAEGPASAWYVARKLHTEVARTAILELDDDVGVKVFVNGVVAAEFAPEPEKPASPEGAAGMKPTEPEEEKIFAMMRGEGRKPPRKIRIGLRAGENHVVLKLIAKGAPPKPQGGGKGGPPNAAQPADKPPADAMGGFGGFGGGGRGGLSFTVAVRPEGDDLLDYETLCALRNASAAQAVAEAAASRPASRSTARSTAAADAVVLGMVAASRPADAESRPETRPAAPTPGGVEPPASRPSADVRRAKVLRRFYRTRIDIAGRVLFEELERLKAERRSVEAKLPQAMVMEELATSRPTHVFVRGDYRRKGARVENAVPSVLPPMAANLPKNRLGLAEWIVAPGNPLFARVTVNRVWQQAFEFGFIRTPEDFGVRGDLPSHPELLDWLATEFVRTEFDLKRLHRSIALSATYRQTGMVPAEVREADLENRLLARGPRQRLTAEMVRDQALFASGLLVEKIGGPSVKPYQPPGLWKSVLGGSDWKPDTGDAAYRRGLYIYWKRGVPYPTFIAFDAAKRENCAVRRTLTTTPLQALATLNDPVFVEAGRALGLRALKEGGKEDDARIAYAFRLVATRAPVERETAALKSLLVDLRTHFKAEPKAAGELLSVGAAKADPKIEATEAAAWAHLGTTILNLEAAIRRG